VTGAESGRLAVTKVKAGYQQVAEQLSSLIYSGQLTAGDRLPSEAELTVAFGVSRSTVREALRALSSTGLTYVMRGVAGGTFVADQDPESISSFLESRFALLSGNEGITADELLEARHLLEVPAAGLAASRRADTHLEAMRESIEAEKLAADRQQRFSHNRGFHALVLEAAGNRLLHVVTSPLFRVIRDRFLDDMTDMTFFAEVDRDHAEIVARISERDVDGARDAMDRHLTRLRAIYQPPSS
jgi:DNA-binding FadR family transcriptional regulator